MKKSPDILKNSITEWLNGNEGVLDSEIELTEEALLLFAKEHAVSPPMHLKNKILAKIKSLNEAAADRKPLELGTLPMLDEGSNWLDWAQAVEGISPPEHYQGIYLHPIEVSDNRKLFVAWVKEYVEEEVHHDLLESFLILEGTCECHITDAEGNARVVRMGAGDFITMGLGETHDVVITSLEPAKAILQWVKIRA